MGQAGEEDFGRASIVELASLEVADDVPSRSMRVLTAWAATVLSIACLAVVGHLFEPRSPACCAAEAAAVGPGRVPRPRPPTGQPTATVVAVAATSRADVSGRLASLEVVGSIDGPAGFVEVRLDDGDATLGVITRHFAPIDGRPPAPAGRFTASFELPAGREPRALRLTVRAFVDERVVGSLSLPIDGSSAPPLQPLHASPRPGSTRLGGLPWLTDPYAS